MECNSSASQNPVWKPSVAFSTGSWDLSAVSWVRAARTGELLSGVLLTLLNATREVVPPEPCAHHWSKHRLQLHLLLCWTLCFHFPAACGWAAIRDFRAISSLCPFTQVLLPVAGCHCYTQARSFGEAAFSWHSWQTQKAPYGDGSSNDSTNFQVMLFNLLK